MKKILYVSPVCHLDEVAAQMNICGVSGSDEILDPSKTSTEPGSGVKAPKIA